MAVHRLVLRRVLLVSIVASAFSVPLASKTVSPATQEPHSTTSSPTEPQQIAISGEQAPRVASATASPVPTATSQPDSEEADCEHLPRDHPLRLKLNGRRLPLRYDALEKGSERRLLSGSKVLPLSDGRMLVALDDNLYMLDVKRRVNWTYTSAEIRDFAFVETTGLVYGSAYDNLMFILDASNGQELYSNGRNGKCAYGRVVPFGKDMCLITDDMMGYRAALEEWESGKIEMIETDGITAWRGTEALWRIHFPPDADLIVRGDKIYAVTKTDKSIYVREIIPPKTN